jgi:hypothetical protein
MAEPRRRSSTTHGSAAVETAPTPRPPPGSFALLTHHRLFRKWLAPETNQSRQALYFQHRPVSRNCGADTLFERFLFGFYTVFWDLVPGPLCLTKQTSGVDTPHSKADHSLVCGSCSLSHEGLTHRQTLALEHLLSAKMLNHQWVADTSAVCLLTTVSGICFLPFRSCRQIFGSRDFRRH